MLFLDLQKKLTPEDCKSKQLRYPYKKAVFFTTRHKEALVGFKQSHEIYSDKIKFDNFQPRKHIHFLLYLMAEL